MTCFGDIQGPTSSCSEKNTEKLYLKEKDNQNALKNTNGRTFAIQIPEFFLETILTGSSKITVQTIVDLFNVAIKVRHKKILCWYCYYKVYKD
ncbi:hypothetical protein RhiirA1_484180 [Rhizophagus irregularis]|uniref:Uncharacterized protein n=1 Tax=Rhizophagus irregularis TaxID=588596 RepID=A0A2N0QJL6_9GLOM|nr:hypothetical protein RhiirA1_484180 [Rhizophagus irregularis]